MKPTIVAAILSLQLIAGCSDSTSPPKEFDQPEPETHAESNNPHNGLAKSDSENQSISLQIAGPDALQTLIEQHHGKVILIDYWATWCLPCVEKFPEIASLAKEFPHDLAVISVSLDDSSMKTSVVEFLKKHNARFDHLLSEYGAGTESMERFDIPGDLPFYRLLDRDGKVRFQFSLDPENLDNGKPVEQLSDRVRVMIAEGQ